MVAKPARGDVWVTDLGLAAKVRPCVVLSVPYDDNERALVTLVPHTTSLRASRFEVGLQQGFLRKGAFDAQSLITVPPVKLVRWLGRLPAAQLALVEQAVAAWLGLSLGEPPTGSPSP